MTKRAATLISFALAVGGCDRGAAPTLPPPRRLAGDDAATTQIVYLSTQTILLKGRPFVLEIADDDHETQTGLMYRREMPADHGMLFAFPDARPRPFWMKNTLIPLDIAYLDANANVLNVEPMYPLDERGVPSRGSMKYAIELNQGAAARIGLRSGDHVELPAALR